MKNRIIEAYRQYISERYSSRSQSSANIMHNAIREAILPIAVENNWSVRTSTHGGEYRMETDFHNKKLDITLFDTANQKVVVAISFKMPLASVNKNLKNYSEMNIGDAALTRDANIPFIYVMFVDSNPWKPTSNITGTEELSQRSIEPFSSIMRANRSNKYRPTGMFVVKCNFNDREYKESQEGLSDSNRKSNFNEHLLYLDHNLSEENIGLSVLTKDNSWDTQFDDLWGKLITLIRFEAEMYKIQLNNF